MGPVERPLDNPSASVQAALAPVALTKGARKSKAKRGHSRDKNSTHASDQEGDAATEGIAAAHGTIPPIGGNGNGAAAVSLRGSACTGQASGEFDTIMLNVNSESPIPPSDQLNAVDAPEAHTVQTVRSEEPSSVHIGSKGKAPASPTPFLSFEKVTTRKRDRLEGESSNGIFQNLNAAFTLESPRPFKRILRQISEGGPAVPWDVGHLNVSALDGVVEDSFIQYPGTGISPTTSERSSAPGEPTGSA